MVYNPTQEDVDNLLNFASAVEKLKAGADTNQAVALTAEEVKATVIYLQALRET